MTREEFVNSLEYKIWLREIKKSFPFIVDATLPKSFEEDWIEYSATIFVELTISNSKFLDENPEFEIWFWQKDKFEKQGERMYNLIFLSEFYISPEDEDAAYKLGREIEDKSGDIHWMIQRQKGIPSEFKLPRAIGVTRYNIAP